MKFIPAAKIGHFLCGIWVMSSAILWFA